MSARYADWNLALSDRYFSGEPGRPAYLAVDDAELASVARQARLEVEEAASDLACAVQQKLDRPPQLFKTWLNELADWRASQPVPPYIALLSVFVLAASRMKAEPEEGISSNDYYKRLNPLLARPIGAEIPPGFEDVARLWEDLAQWLDEDLDGARGTSTFQTHEWFPHIGYPLAQCALRASDRHRLPDFFRSARLEPGDTISDERLLALLRAWAAKPAAALSAAGRRAVLEGGHDFRSTAIVAIVQRELAAWDGQLRDVEGRRRAECHLLLDVRRNQITSCAVVAPHPDGFPAEAVWRDNHGRDVPLSTPAAGWYGRIPVADPRKVFERPLDLTAEGFALSFRIPPLLVFSKTFVPESGWISQPRAALREEHMLIARTNLRDALEDFLRRHASRGWARVPQSTTAIPRGWDVYGNVVVETISTVDPPAGLEPLVPRLNTATRISGGCKLGSGLYLKGGEPDLLVTVGEGEHTTVLIDGREERLHRGILDLKLYTLRLEEGQHEIFAGGRTIRFTTVRTIGRIEPEQAGELAHIIEWHGDYQPRAPIASDGAGGPAAPGTIEVCGAHLDASTEDLPVAQTPPVVLRVGFVRYQLLGSAPGEVFTPQHPSSPAWLAPFVPAFQFFECEPPFRPEMVVLTGQERPHVRPIAASPAPPSSPASDSTAKGRCAWAQAILRAAARDPEIPKGFEAAWESYLDAARDTARRDCVS